MSVEVSDSQNGGHIAFCDEEYAERKAMKNGSSNLTADERKLERGLLNPNECGA